MDIATIRRENLRSISKEIGSHSLLAEKLERDLSQISQVIGENPTRNIGSRLARSIESKLEKPHGWLDVSHEKNTDHHLGEMKVSEPERGFYNVDHGPNIIRRVPLISWVQAGNWCEAIDSFQIGDAEDWMMCPVGHGPRTYVLRVRGESMHNPNGRPSFIDGDLIFVDPDRQAVNGSLVICRLEDDKEATFKKLVIEGDHRYLRPLNPVWPQQVIEINQDATICGVVIFKGEQL